MRHQIRWQSERGPRNFLVDMSCTSPVSGAGSSDNKSAQRADSQSCHTAELHPAALVKLPRRLGVIGALVLISANLLTFSTTVPVRVPYRDVYAQLSAQGKPGPTRMRRG